MWAGDINEVFPRGFEKYYNCTEIIIVILLI